MDHRHRVAIVGFGHVGNGMRQIFPEAVIYDKFLPDYSDTRAQINECELGIICVPTPKVELDGSCDVSMVEEVVSWLETPLILIKSTVPPRTTERLRQKYRKRIVVSPEYFGESSYWLPEAFSPRGWPYLILGGERKDTGAILSIFTPVLGPDKIYRQTDSRTAELTKFMENAWLACQITFANEFAAIANTFEVDYSELRELWGLDPRVSRWHTLVFPEKPGFGGKCLPKDLQAIIAEAGNAGYDARFLEEVWQSNIRFQSSLYTSDGLVNRR